MQDWITNIQKIMSSQLKLKPNSCILVRNEPFGCINWLLWKEREAQCKNHENLYDLLIHWTVYDIWSAVILPHFICHFRFSEAKSLEFAVSNCVSTFNTAPNFKYKKVWHCYQIKKKHFYTLTLLTIVSSLLTSILPNFLISRVELFFERKIKF